MYYVFDQESKSVKYNIFPFEDAESDDQVVSTSISVAQQLQLFALRPPKPLLKWIGNKQRYASQIVNFMPEYNTYIEPFPPNPYDLLFLCRACYGGVVRFTKDGRMSTPVGAHRAISPQSLMQRIYAWRERVHNTTFIHADFELTMANATKGDLVYCDPPYEYTQRILYGAQDFSLERLWTAIERGKSRGAKVILSLDGKKKSGSVTLHFNIPKGLFEREVSIDCGGSMLRRFQKRGETMENEVVHDGLLLTW